MLFYNGHGSNQNLIEISARLVMLEHPEVLAAAGFVLSSAKAQESLAELRESERGGMAHACELETSLYLAIDPDAVDMDKAVDETSYPVSENAWMDWSEGGLKVMPWWSSFTDTGVQGAPTKATAEKGKAWLDVAVDEVLSYVREIRSMPLPARRTPASPSEP